MLRTVAASLLLVAIVGTPIVAFGQEILPDGSQAAAAPIAGFRVPAGLKIELFAAEPQLSGPVAICLDEQGRVYVAEEYRFNRGTEENRTRPFFLEDDLQIRSLDDRLAMYRKFADKFAGGMKWFTQVSDQVRRLEDTDGNGRADVSTIFAGKFNGVLDGLAAGVIAKDGDVYLTCIPHLWLLRDQDGDGVAEFREPLLTGFGVNAGFLGHDLHGLAWGPDGRLYFSVGDRGYNVTTKEGRKLVGPRRGAVFRCEPDGSQLEVVHQGLRNPQEIAFDEFGNLFAADNNCDKGDLSRLVYIVEGGDSGWNMAYQTIAAPYLTGPWHAEKMWHIDAAERPAWVTPPVGHLGAGPGGFAYYPGSGLPARYLGHFFLCNYTGNGGIESFAVKPKGAGFEIVDEHDFFKPIKATDVDFGYDGKMYVSDFVNLDWSGKSLGGRIYTVFHPDHVKAGAVAVKAGALIRQGFRDRPLDEFRSGLLDHPDMRVRLRAQYELVRRGNDETVRWLHAEVHKNSTTPTRRRHTIWALGQLGRTRPEVIPPLRELLADRDADARAQTAKVLGDLRDHDAAEPLIGLLRHDQHARVRFFAAVALGRMKSRDAVGPLFDLIRTDKTGDAFLFHAAVVALHRIDDVDAVLARMDSENVDERLAVVLVLRRRASTQLARFLADPAWNVATEAARAINDLPVDPATEPLAAALERTLDDPRNAPNAFTRRAIHANFRLGGEANAQLLVRLVTNNQADPVMRREALAALSDWANPGSRDRVNGFWRPLPDRGLDIIRAVIQGNAERLLAGTDGSLLTATLKLLSRFEIKVDDDRIADWALDRQRPTNTRVEALRLLAARKSPRVDKVARRCLTGSPPLKIAAWEQLLRHDEPFVIDSIRESLDDSSNAELLQGGARILGELKSGRGDKILAAAMQHLLSATEAVRSTDSVPSTDSEPSTDDRPPANAAHRLQLAELEIVAAATNRNSDPLKPLIANYHAKVAEISRTDPLGRFRAALVGGDAARGRAIFLSHRRAQCVRCHKVHGYGGVAGPDLSQAGVKRRRKYLLESLIHPNANIAKGFGSVSLIMDDGRVLSGTIRSESDDEIELESPQGKPIRVAVSNVEARTNPRSPMPAVGDVLTPRELRDLVEFLSGLAGDSE